MPEPSPVVRAKALASGAGDWLEALPALVGALERDWAIRVGRAYPDATEALVAEALTATGTPAVLKLLMPRDGDAAADEIAVLQRCGGTAASPRFATTPGAVRSSSSGSAGRCTSMACRRGSVTRSSAPPRSRSGDRPLDSASPRARRRRSGWPAGSSGPGRSWSGRARPTPSPTLWPARTAGPRPTLRRGPSSCTATCTNGMPWRPGRATATSWWTRTGSRRNPSTTSASSCARTRSTCWRERPHRPRALAGRAHRSRCHRHLGVGRGRAGLDRAARRQGGAAAGGGTDARGGRPGGPPCLRSSCSSVLGRPQAFAPPAGSDRVTSVEVPVSGHCDARFRAVREEFARNFAERGEVGAAVCVVVDGETVVDLAGGWADARHARRGGTTHWWTSTRSARRSWRLLALQLVDDGLVALDDPIADGVAGVRRRGQGGGDVAPRVVPPGGGAGHPRAAHQRRPVGLGPDDRRARGDRRPGGSRGCATPTTPTRTAI